MGALALDARRLISPLHCSTASSWKGVRGKVAASAQPPHDSPHRRKTQTPKQRPVGLFSEIHVATIPIREDFQRNGYARFFPANVNPGPRLRARNRVHPVPESLSPSPSLRDFQQSLIPLGTLGSASGLAADQSFEIFLLCAGVSAGLGHGHPHPKADSGIRFFQKMQTHLRPRLDRKSVV